MPRKSVRDVIPNTAQRVREFPPSTITVETRILQRAPVHREAMLKRASQYMGQRRLV
jgi:hypothetical protein